MAGSLKLPIYTNVDIPEDKTATEVTIYATIDLIQKGISHKIIIVCLLSSGYSAERANTILRWAIKHNEKMGWI